MRRTIQSAKSARSISPQSGQRNHGKAMRKTEGSTKAKQMRDNDDRDVLGKAKVATKAERKEAAKARKAAATSALKKGEISSGEK